MWLIKQVLLVLVALCVLVSCNKKNDEKQQVLSEHIAVVEKKPNIKKIYYQGNVKPLSILKIVSPETGVVSSLNFRYGQYAEKDQLLFKVESKEIEEDFQAKLTKFLQAKDRLLNSEVKYHGAEMLYKDRVISKQEYLNEKSSYENNKLNYLESKLKLESILKKIPGLDESVEKITLDDIRKIQGLYEKHLDKIPVKTSKPGIVLFPKKKKDGADELLEVGSNVKKQQSVLSIGDLSGIQIEFNVGQKEINQLKSGFPVKVTIDALSGVLLSGEISDVAVQASGVGENVSFPVLAVVKSLSEMERKKIRVGMLAKVEVDIESDAAIMIPINAVFMRDGKTFVKIVDSKKAEHQDRQIQTGRTLANDVIVIGGLKEGEKVIYHDPAK